MAKRKNCNVNQPDPPQEPSFNRHASHCTICVHPKRDEIEADFISWVSPANIAAEFGLRDRTAIYRHAKALNLVSRRGRNLLAVLDRIIEKGDDVRVTASVVIQAIVLRARINARGEFIEHDERISTHDLFEKMTDNELALYAEKSILPDWVPRLKNETDQGSGCAESA